MKPYVLVYRLSQTQTRHAVHKTHTVYRPIQTPGLLWCWLKPCVLVYRLGQTQTRHAVHRPVQYADPYRRVFVKYAWVIEKDEINVPIALMQCF